MALDSVVFEHSKKGDDSLSRSCQLEQHESEDSLPGIYTGVLTLDTNDSLWRFCVNNLRKVRANVGPQLSLQAMGNTDFESSNTHVVVIAMRAVLVALIIFRHILSECFLAFFADEYHLRGLGQWMGLCLCMAFRAVVPLFAAGCSNGDLCVENVFAESTCMFES